LNNDPPSSEHQPGQHEEMSCAGDARKEKNTREDEDDVKSEEGGEEHLAEQFHLRHLVVVDVVAADSLAGDELGDVVAVVVEEDRHGGEQGGADNNPNGAENEGSGSCGEAETAGAEDRHPPSCW